MNSNKNEQIIGINRKVDKVHGTIFLPYRFYLFYRTTLKRDKENAKKYKKYFFIKNLANFQRKKENKRTGNDLSSKRLKPI